MLIKSAIEESIRLIGKEIKEWKITIPQPVERIKQLEKYRDVLGELAHDEIMLNCINSRLQVKIL